MVSPVDHDRPDMPDSDAEDGWSTEKTVAVGLVVAVERLILAVALLAVIGSFGLGLGEEGDNTDGRGRAVWDDSLGPGNRHRRPPVRLRRQRRVVSVDLRCGARVYYL
jgi:hypothetical protein